MTTITPPTVGRKVWYRANAEDQRGPRPMVSSCEAAGSTKRKPLDATVIAVWGDRMVNLLVVDQVGNLFPKLSVTLLQEGDTAPTDFDGEEIGGYAEWMPYQKTQHAKQAT
jgi:hypothetical protein